MAVSSEETDLKKFYRVDELVKILNISRSLVFNLIHEGVIPSVRLGEKCILVPVSFVEELEKSALVKIQENKK